MKVLEVIHLVPNKFGSFEKYSLGYGVFLRAQGHQHHAIYQGEACDVLKQEVAAAGGSLSAYNYRRLGLRRSLHLLRYIRQNDIDIVHFHFYPAFGVFSLLANFIPCKVFYSYRFSGEFSSKPRWVMWLKRLRSRIVGTGINGVFCVSGFARKKFIHNYQAAASLAHVVHNGLNWDYFPVSTTTATTGRNNSETADAHFDVICVAALIREKGVIDVIDAVEKLKPSIPTLRLCIIGDGNERSALESSVQEAGLAAQVTFLGSRDDVPQQLCKADIAVVPSRWGEAFGFTVIEAMATGLPVIASSVGGIPEIIDHGQTGLLVNKASPDDIAEAIQRLYEDESLRQRLGAAARERVETYFNVIRVYRQQLDFYRELG